jgi:DNA-binding NarL/FixJ family response regulator
LGHAEETAFTAALAAGRTLPLEDVVAEAAAILGAVASSPPARPSSPAKADLTPREREVLRLLVEGRVDREIAAALAVSPRTVTTHVARILDKLGAPTRAAAAAQAVRRGLI